MATTGELETYMCIVRWCRSLIVKSSSIRLGLASSCNLRTASSCLFTSQTFMDIRSKSSLAYKIGSHDEHVIMNRK